MRYAGGISLPPVQKLVAPLIFPVFTGKNVIESLIRFPPESWGFFFHSPLLKFGFFQIFKGGFLVSLRFSLTR